MPPPKVRHIALAALSVGSFYTVADPDRRRGVFLASTGLTRLGRAGFYSCVAAADFQLNCKLVGRRHGENSPQHVLARKEVDLRNAKRLLRVCELQGSVFQKLGQYLGTLKHVLPVEWTDTLASLQDRAPFHPWEEMVVVLNEDFSESGGWKSLFESISETPVAAASLAQVHLGTTKDGDVVAVKIQYPSLHQTAFSDLSSMQFLFSALAYFYPSLDMNWLFPDFYRSLNAEVDFLQEASNGQRVAKMYEKDPYVVIPAVYPHHTTPRILTTSFVHGGISPRSAEKLLAAGLDPASVGREIVKFSMSQIFVHGFVHLDLHPGNLLIVPSPSTPSRPFRVCVLDHGMYRQLSPPFRRGYGAFWTSLITRDVGRSVTAAKQMGLEPSDVEHLSLLLTRRPPPSTATGPSSSSTSVSSPGETSSNVDAVGNAPPLTIADRLSPEERSTLRSKYANVTTMDINNFLQRLPRDLLFVLRAHDLMRGVTGPADRGGLGVPSAERLVLLGKAAQEGDKWKNFDIVGERDGTKLDQSRIEREQAFAIKGKFIEEPAGGVTLADVIAMGAKAVTDAVSIAKRKHGGVTLHSALKDNLVVVVPTESEEIKRKVESGQMVETSVGFFDRANVNVRLRIVALLAGWWGGGQSKN